MQNDMRESLVTERQSLFFTPFTVYSRCAHSLSKEKKRLLPTEKIRLFTGSCPRFSPASLQRAHGNSGNCQKTAQFNRTGKTPCAPM
jgi:hypothetical protein